MDPSFVTTFFVHLSRRCFKASFPMAWLKLIKLHFARLDKFQIYVNKKSVLDHLKRPGPYLQTVFKNILCRFFLKVVLLSNASKYIEKKCRGQLGPYSPTILKKVLSLFVQIFLQLEAFECNTTSDWLNNTVWPIRSCVTFKFTKYCRKRQKML